MADKPSNDPRKLYPSLITLIDNTMRFVEANHKRNGDGLSVMMIDDRKETEKWKGVFYSPTFNCPPDPLTHNYKNKPKLYFIVLDDDRLYEGYIYLMELPEKYNYFLALTAIMDKNSKQYKDKCIMLQNHRKKVIEHQQHHICNDPTHNHGHNHVHNDNSNISGKEEEEHDESDEEELTKIKDVQIKEEKKKAPPKRRN